MFLAGALAACNSQENDHQFDEAYMLKIVNDPLFKNYQQASGVIQKNVVTGVYDMKAIGRIIYGHPEVKDICVSRWIKDEFVKVRGGELYFDNHCDVWDIKKQLDEKFNYSEIPLNTVLAMNELYRELYLEETEKIEKEIFNKTVKNEN